MIEEHRANDEEEEVKLEKVTYGQEEECRLPAEEESSHSKDQHFGTSI